MMHSSEIRNRNGKKSQSQRRRRQTDRRQKEIAAAPAICQAAKDLQGSPQRGGVNWGGVASGWGCQRWREGKRKGAGYGRVQHQPRPWPQLPSGAVALLPLRERQSWPCFPSVTLQLPQSPRLTPTNLCTENNINNE